jgi:uncharacterized protein involved in cysteine biosynthesis
MKKLPALKIIEGDESDHGGYSLDGVEYLGEIPEALVDEAKKISYSIGRNVLYVLFMLIGGIDLSENLKPLDYSEK